MASLRLKLVTTAPTFLKGADPKGDPEFRAASIRGQLRYWLRAMLGAYTQDLKEIWKHESAVFGSTERGSVVTVRVSRGVVKQNEESNEPRDNRNPPRYKPYLLPHRPNDREKSPDYAIRPGTQVTLDLLTRPAVTFPEDVKNALSLWLLLGGVGKRSRRMMGGLQLASLTNDNNLPIPEWMTITPDTPQLWAEWYQYELINMISQPTSQTGEIPKFPTLHPSHSCVLVGQRLFDSATDANQALFGLLRNNIFRPNSDAFGYAGGGGRRASPVIAQVRKLDDDHYFPVLTIFQSNPLKPRDWNTIMNSFIDAAKTTFNATHVYGVEKFT
jgi:CRISPR-associated protein Cmr1